MVQVPSRCDGIDRCDSDARVEVDQVLADPLTLLFVRRREAPASHANPVAGAIGTLLIRAIHRDWLLHLDGDHFVRSALPRRIEKRWPEILEHVKRHGHGWGLGDPIDPKRFDALAWCRALCWNTGVRAYEEHLDTVDRAARLRLQLEEQIASTRVAKASLAPHSTASRPLDDQIRSDLSASLRPLRMGEFHARRVASSGEPLLHAHLLGDELLITEVRFEGFSGYGSWRTADGIISGEAMGLTALGLRQRDLTADEAEALLSSTRKAGFIAATDAARLVAVAQQAISRRVSLHKLADSEPWIAAEHEKLRQRLVDLNARREIARTAKARSQAKLNVLLNRMAAVQRCALANARAQSEGT